MVVYNTNLGRVQFFNFNFSNFNSIEIYDSFLSEMITANVAWFDDKALVVTQPNNTQEKDYSKKKREVYRQLKQAMERQSDRIQALEFKSRELFYHKMDVAISGKKWWHQDRLSLLVGNINGFGLDWAKPVWCTIIVTFIAWFLIVIAASPDLKVFANIQLVDYYKTFNIWWCSLELFPQLFNPARNLKQILPEGYQVNFGVAFFDVLHRIILGVLIYSIISAFRKFFK